MNLNVRKGHDGGFAKAVAGSSFAYGNAGTDIDSAEYKPQVVRVTTLDSEIDEDVFVLKVDVQGWEPHVFRGALNLLQKRNVTFVIFELAPYTLCEAGFNPMGVVNLLNCLGYVCFDARWSPTADTTRKYTKRPRPGDTESCDCDGKPAAFGVLVRCCSTTTRPLTIARRWAPLRQEDAKPDFVRKLGE